MCSSQLITCGAQHRHPSLTMISSEYVNRESTDPTPQHPYPQVNPTSLQSSSKERKKREDRNKKPLQYHSRCHHYRSSTSSDTQPINKPKAKQSPKPKPLSFTKPSKPINTHTQQQQHKLMAPDFRGLCDLGSLGPHLVARLGLQGKGGVLVVEGLRLSGF